MNLLRRDGPLLRIGHRGAAALAPPNTIAAIEAALEAGVDMVELDILGRPDRTLVLGHSLRELDADPLALDDALAFLAERSPETGLIADIKFTGFEPDLVEALRRHGFVEKTVASTHDRSTLLTLRELEPALTRSRTYARDRLRVGERRTFLPIVGPALLALRLALPFRIGRILAEADASATTLHYRLASRAVIERCHALGAAVLVWTVDDRTLLRRLDQLGVDGVITNDPRIFRATLQA
jgi:glycerophosphoryl diester phosphodiesterase